MHLSELKRLSAKRKRKKYNNEVLKVGNLTFDSKKEYERYLELKLLLGQGKISDLQIQVKFELAPSVKFEGEEKAKPALRYFADFTYVKDGQFIVEDVKSKATRKDKVYIIKKHLMKSVHNLDISEV